MRRSRRGACRATSATDRDALTWRGRSVELVEGQLRKNDWASWRVFLYDPASRRACPLHIRTHGGSVAFGNPTITAVTSPTGADAIVVTLFLFSEGAAAGEAGQLVYYRQLP
jgi:hypothetical protein